jgi:ferredoxin
MAMEGMGPGFGDPRHLGLFIAGTDAVAVDRVVVDMLNVQAHMVPVLDVALREGYGVGKLEDISIVGEKLVDVRVLDFKLSPREDPFMKIPIPIKKFLKTYLTNHPTIIQKRCEVCKLCLQACPMKCISCENNKVKIHNKNCIKCLCCLEACPHAAVDLKPGGLLKAYQGIRRIL